MSSNCFYCIYSKKETSKSIFNDLYIRVAGCRGDPTDKKQCDDGYRGYFREYIGKIVFVSMNPEENKILESRQSDSNTTRQELQ